MWIYFVLFGVSMWAYYVTSRRGYYKLAKQIPGPQGYPLIGSALDFMRNTGRTLTTLCKYIDEFGDRVFFYYGPIPVVVMNNVEDIEKACTSTELIDKSEEYNLIKEWLGEGILISTGSLWTHRRKLVTPCFHFSVLESFIGPINRHAAILVKVLKDAYSKRNEYMDISHMIQKCTLDAILETSMGKEMNSQTTDDGSINAYFDAIHRLGELFQYRTVRPWLHNDFIWRLTSRGRENKACCDYIHSITDKVIAERKKSFNFNEDTTPVAADSDDFCFTKKVKRPLLDLLLEAQAKDPTSISDVGLRHEITTFIFAGHDTTANAISYCLFCIGNHPEVYAKIRDELFRIFETDRERPITSADLKEMKYLELCIKETLRLYPSAPHLGRAVKKPFKLDENTILPPGVGVYILPFTVHRNPKYWPNPEQFIPERFDPDNSEYGKTTRSPFCYIPFSAGPRNCIGQKLAMIEAKIILATLLRNFTLESERPISELELIAAVVLRAEGGLKMKFKHI